MCTADLAAMMDWSPKTQSFLCYGWKIETQVTTSQVTKSTGHTFEFPHQEERVKIDYKPTKIIIVLLSLWITAL